MSACLEGNGMKNRIKNVINNWDPIGLLEFSPDDEYSHEINEIEKLVTKAKDSDELAEGIYSVFHESFGDDIFRNSKKDCITIARLILNTGKTTASKGNDAIC